MAKVNINSLLFSVFLATGIAGCGFFVSQTLFKANVGINTAESKGLAEMTVKADTAHWRLDFTVSAGSETALKSLYDQALDRQQAIVHLLKQNGFHQKEMSMGVITYHLQEYRDEKQQLVEAQHILNGSVKVTTTHVERVDKARSQLNSLIAKGYQINNHAPEYLFTQLNKIKPAMLKQATENARIAATEFAEVAGVSVGGIRTARQGNFTIRDQHYQYSDNQSLYKNVRVVTTIVFYLVE